MDYIKQVMILRKLLSMDNNEQQVKLYLIDHVKTNGIKYPKHLVKYYISLCKKHNISLKTYNLLYNKGVLNETN